jgi:hypothetical protein
MARSTEHVEPGVNADDRFHPPRPTSTYERNGDVRHEVARIE